MPSRFNARLPGDRWLHWGLRVAAERACTVGCSLTHGARRLAEALQAEVLELLANAQSFVRADELPVRSDFKLPRRLQRAVPGPDRVNADPGTPTIEPPSFHSTRPRDRADVHYATLRLQTVRQAMPWAIAAVSSENAKTMRAARLKMRVARTFLAGMQTAPRPSPMPTVPAIPRLARGASSPADTIPAPPPVPWDLAPFAVAEPRRRSFSALQAR
jgi:hypothetical protein